MERYEKKLRDLFLGVIGCVIIGCIISITGQITEDDMLFITIIGAVSWALYIGFKIVDDGEEGDC